MIRHATCDDAEAIATIYNHYVSGSSVTFDIESKSAADRAEWLAQRGDGHPVFVAEHEGAVVAWGSLSPFRARLAARSYRRTSPA